MIAGISDFRDKILVATDRLKSAIQLVPLYRDNYLTYLQNHAEQAVNVVVEFDAEAYYGEERIDNQLEAAKEYLRKKLHG